jgi:hypothetical protein
MPARGSCKITGKGERELLRTIPLWRPAQARFATA